MRTTLSKILLAIVAAALFALQSCSEFEQRTDKIMASQDIKVVNNRLSFTSTKVFMETLTEINKMKPDELLQWQGKYEFPSLFNRVDTLTADSLSLKRFPNGHQAVLNIDGEVIIGDTIVWYAVGGMKHYVPNMNEGELVKIKHGLVISKITGTYGISRLSKVNKEDKAQGRYIWTAPSNGEKGPNHQHEFYYHNDTGSRRKFVTELWNTIDNSQYTIYLVAKLEWYGSRSHSWKEAGEWRNVFYNFNFTASLYGGRDARLYGATYGNKSGSAVVNRNLNIFVSQDVLFYSNSTYWDIDIRGDLYQEVYDDQANGWDDVGFPMF